MDKINLLRMQSTLIESKKIFVNLFIPLIIAIVLLFASELTLRHIFPGKIYKIPKQLFVFDRDLLVALKPNIKTDPGVILFTTNANSFRGNSLMSNPQIRIIVYGDSNVMSMFANIEQTFPYKLEKYLKNVLGKRVEVINAGVQGYGPDQYLKRFEKEVKIFKPNLVIFVVFADNDFGDIIRNRLFEIDCKGNLVRTSFLPTLDRIFQNRNSFKYFLSSLLITRGAKKIVEIILKKMYIIRENKNNPEELKSKQFSVEKDYIRQNIASNCQEFQAYVESKPSQSSVFNDSYDMDIALFPNSESAREKIRLMSAILIKANKLAYLENSKFLVLILPSEVDLSKKARSAYFFSYEDLQEFPGYDRTNLTKPIEEGCISNKINYLNLFDVFSQVNADQFYLDDGHWSEKGQDLSARMVLKYVMPRKLLR